MHAATDKPNGSPSRRLSMIRQGVEFFVCLALAVTLFRAFAAEGYMIKTGSMAPCLLGYHRHATCPSCRFPFDVDESPVEATATCPNCGLPGIEVRKLPRNDGDQLLVFRGAYEYQPPRRWEVVVFRNPSRPTQAYVKRLGALPGETGQIIRGDLYVEGKIQTKDLAIQRGMRLPVFDHHYRPPENDPDWQPRWVIEESKGDKAKVAWQSHGAAFTFDGLQSPAAAEGDALPLSQQTEVTTSTTTEAPFAWVRYRHWVRSGGNHATSVHLAAWPASLSIDQTSLEQLRYDLDTQTLVCRGAMLRDVRERLLAAVTDDESRRAVEQLYTASHVAPITDTYGYNRARGTNGEYEVRDLMVSLQLSISGGKGEFALGLTDGTQDFECRFDTAERQVRLVDVRTGKILRGTVLPAGLAHGRALVELSLMDRQVLLAIDGKLVFEPWIFDAPAERGPTPWQPVRFGARGLQAQVAELQLFRDVYYTSGEGRRGFDAPVKLGSEEYFALGDNSPVSRDSRSWPAGKVLTADMLLGKPFLVHLPSRQQRFKVGPWQMDIRIPEFSRVRYIR